MKKINLGDKLFSEGSRMAENQRNGLDTTVTICLSWEKQKPHFHHLPNIPIKSNP
jgi:hypothetical protein